MPLFPAGERRVGISHIQIAVRAATTTAYGLETGSARDELPPLACEEEDLANCDQSTLTGCETNVTWHERHCGGCGQLCSGLCLGRICHEDTLIWEGNAYEVVSSTTTAFALVASQSGPYAVLQIDVLTAKASVLIDAADDDWQLAVSADRVYLLDPSAGVIRSARFDGTDLETEAAPQAVDSIGASLQGAYYVDTVELSDASSSSISRLWFRGTGEPSWTLLRESSSSEIIASSPYGVLVEDFEGEQRALLEVRGDVIKAWTSEIESLPWQRAALTERGPVLSVPNQETGKGELYWLGDAVSHYALPHSNDELSFARLNVLGAEVVLYREDNGTASIQQYDWRGPTLLKGGLASGSDLMYIDSEYVWLSIWDSAATRRITRATWFAFEAL